MTMQDHQPPEGTPNLSPPEPLDERCDAEDRILDDLLARSAPRDVPQGLVDRVYDASLKALATGRRNEPTPLIFAGWGRLAAAACIVLAVGLLFWLVGPDARRAQPPVADLADGRLMQDELNPMARFRGLALVSALNYDTAVADLEMVLDGVVSGAPSKMVLAPGATTREHFENELDAVHAVSLQGS